MNIYYWPPGIPREYTLAAYCRAYEALGFTPCADGDVQPEVEKVALFALPTGTPTHAVRQLPNGKWTSKLGVAEDIEYSLHGLVSPAYGSVVQFLKRPPSDR